ncbi:MAG TPA: carbon dioxide concentrating mechanism protein CcmL [Planctomycetaceae bacterium]|nr:carbon dioxide concentrating mechanism protein CcmL [Planctomycetaceae bacterium]
MRIAKVLGNVTLARGTANWNGARWKLVVPMGFEELMDEREPGGEELVAYDDMGVGCGEWVALSEGTGAARPFFPEGKPIDAYVAAILDTVEIATGREDGTGKGTES